MLLLYAIIAGLALAPSYTVQKSDNCVFPDSWASTTWIVEKCSEDMSVVRLSECFQTNISCSQYLTDFTEISEYKCRDGLKDEDFQFFIYELMPTSNTPEGDLNTWGRCLKYFCPSDTVCLFREQPLAYQETASRCSDIITIYEPALWSVAVEPDNIDQSLRSMGVDCPLPNGRIHASYFLDGINDEYCEDDEESTVAIFQDMITFNLCGSSRKGKLPLTNTFKCLGSVPEDIFSDAYHDGDLLLLVDLATEGQPQFYAARYKTVRDVTYMAFKYGDKDNQLESQVTDSYDGMKEEYIGLRIGVPPKKLDTLDVPDIWKALARHYRYQGERDINIGFSGDGLRIYPDLEEVTLEELTFLNQLVLGNSIYFLASDGAADPTYKCLKYVQVDGAILERKETVSSFKKVEDCPTLLKGLPYRTIVSYSSPMVSSPDVQ